LLPPEAAGRIPREHACRGHRPAAGRDRGFGWNPLL
jgi:hypothetical protein